MPALRLLLALSFLLAGSALRVQAQPTYKLDVRKDLNPKATLSLKGEQVVRSEVTDDPGFRLQFHFKKADKTLATADGRGETGAKLPSLEAGEYSVVLELFYPAYKGGTAQKGEFKAISEVLRYRVEAGGKATVMAMPPAPKK